MESYFTLFASKLNRVTSGLALVAGCFLSPGIAHASNLLVNGDFNAPLTNTWTTWIQNDGWANRQNDASSHDGTYYIACGGGNPDNSSGGIYQVIPATAGALYTLVVKSGVQAWWWPQGQMKLSFLNAADVSIESHSQDVTTSITDYDTGLAWSNYTLNVTAPVGTVKVKVEFASHSGSGTVWFDDAVLSVSHPPTIKKNGEPSAQSIKPSLVSPDHPPLSTNSASPASTVSSSTRSAQQKDAPPALKK